MRLITMGLALAGTVGLGGPALGGEGHSARSIVEHIFDVADEDGSGTLTRAEYEGARLQDFGVTFEESDTNADGETSLAEYLALYEQHHGSGDGVGL